MSCMFPQMSHVTYVGIYETQLGEVPLKSKRKVKIWTRLGKNFYPHIQKGSDRKTPGSIL